jgi:hypothetical protein
MSRPSAEQVVATELVALVRDVPVGASLDLQPSSRLCAGLERYLPQLLRRGYPAWLGESFDGISPIQAVKVYDRTVLVAATGILISDQTITPLLAELTATDSGDAIASFRVCVGEPGGGSLGISGPPCNSGAALRLASRLAGRLEQGRVDWVYVTASDPVPGGGVSHG